MGGTDRYVQFDDMTWPNPDDPGNVEWRLRYGTPTKSDLLVAASFIGAYRQIVNDTQRVRNAKIAGIRRSTVAARADRSAAAINEEPRS